MKRIAPLIPLRGNQKLASEPREQIWLSASAGTGKTHVLSARVMRLLLSGADPSTILCLTFTKAGAAEMADRIHQRLAHWVRLMDAELAADLVALGEDPGPQNRDFARTLFARVLDASGGGLRIQTIHSFCQTLLAGFPVEAGLIPGFRPLEAREEAALARQTLADLLITAEGRSDAALIGAVQALSRRLGEGGAESFLMHCARAPDALEVLGDDIPTAIRDALDIPPGDIEEEIARQCGEFDRQMLLRIAAANAAWGTKTANGHLAVLESWTGASLSDRPAMLAELAGVVLTAKGELRAFSSKLIDAEPEYAALAGKLAEHCTALLGLRSRAALAELLGNGLEAGRAYARAYAEAKRLAGAVDFDDLIRKTVALLGQSRMAEWIRFKLDQATDHILVDEAQDTNAHQWAIITALAGEFFAGDGAKGEKVRTIFSVGDFKQAIFGFQGTDPLNFGAAQLYFAARAGEAGGDLRDLTLSESYRSTAPVLELVDALLGDMGHDALGLMESAEPHRSAVPGPGVVTLWNPISPHETAGDDLEGEEGWLTDSARAFATRLARQIRGWLDAPLWLESKGRPLRPEDILILVRRRGDLAALIVARLYAEGVPVAGVDRLRLNAPLAVRDLLAAIRFALQPDDDLNLAALLVSPLLGWSQDDLLLHASKPRKHSLYRYLRGEGALPAALGDMLGQADFTTPYNFLENLLSGPLDGRRKLLRRLGHQARDPIEELLSAALQFENDAIPSLQLFLDWFDRGDVDIVRDPSAPLDAVRVMTAHGAKGLQAPLVILADATVDPALSPRGKLDWRIAPDAEPIPVFRPRREELSGSLREAAERSDQRELEEHWRLLYVALTRAEERLVIGGALGPRAKGIPPEKSWYAAVERAVHALGVEAEADAEWGAARHFRGTVPAAPVSRRAQDIEAAPQRAPLPDWLTRPAPVEARPPRPLAPSAIGVDDVANPPPGPGMRAAAERGRLLHALFERLPDVPPADRQDAAMRWLAQAERVEDIEERARITADALRVINDPAHADLFGGDALAEAPIAAVVAGDVIAGTVDRLLVGDAVIRVVDFKTGRRVPASAEEVPVHHLRQMSAYAEALAVVFPDRKVEAALLYTSGPTLIALPPHLLARHKPGLQPSE